MKEVSEADDADKTQIRSRALPAHILGSPALFVELTYQLARQRQ